MRTKILQSIICVMALLALPCVTEATLLDTVDISHTDFGAYGPVMVWAAGHNAMVTTGGVYMLEKTAGTGEGNMWPNGPLPGFCMELEEIAPTGTTHTYGVLMPEDVHNSTRNEQLGVAKADYISELWGKFYDPAWAAAGPHTPVQYSDAVSFAVAIWEIIYEDLPTDENAWDVFSDGTPGDGGFAAQAAGLGWAYDSAHILTANNWLHQLDGAGAKANLRSLVFNGYQDYLVQVPEPASIILLGLGGIVSLVRKKKAAS